MHVGPGDVAATASSRPDAVTVAKRNHAHGGKTESGHHAVDVGVVGRYVLTPRIFHHLRTMKAGAGGEIQLTDGIVGLMSEEKVLAYEFEGRRYDCGSKLGYLEASVDYGLKHPELAEDFAAFLRERGASLKR